MRILLWIEDSAFKTYTEEHQEHWDRMAVKPKTKNSWGKYYWSWLAKVYSFCIPQASKVLEIGCGKGNLLASLKPSFGVGVDFSNEMIEYARKTYPDLSFLHMDAHFLDIKEKFDYIILSDVLNDAWDVQEILSRLHPCCHNETKIICNFFNHLWKGPLSLTRKFGLTNPTMLQNWLTREDMTNLLRLSGFEVIRSWSEFLCPVNIPLIAPFMNVILAKLWPFKHLDLANFLIARPMPSIRPKWREQKPIVSVLVPARNEAGNIEKILERIPEMGGGTEILFVEGNSTDDTYEVIQKAIANCGRNCKLFKQPGRGKGDAVRKGFAEASGEILMILDADITVPPEDLPRFYQAIYDGTAEFVNGVRLVYPMEKQAMRFFNLLGNKFFSAAFSWLLGQPLRDTLCGTKVLTKANYEHIVDNREYFGDFDPFGDFDLLFGAAKLNLKLIDLPVRYRDRTYGETNIERWKHGWMLLKMVVYAAFKVKFV